MKTRYGNEDNKPNAIASYVPVRLRAVLVIVPAMTVLLILAFGDFLETSWNDGIKDGLGVLVDNTLKALWEIPKYAVQRLIDGDDPLKPAWMKHKDG